MMRVLGEQLFDLAQRLQDADLLLEAHHAVWGSLVFGGELAAAQPHLEQGLRLYEPQRHRTHAALYSGHDPGMCCRVHTALALWLRGLPRPGGGQQPGGASPDSAARTPPESGSSP